MFVAAKKELAASDRGRGADRFGEAIQCEEPRHITAANDYRCPIEIGDVDATGGGDRGGIDVVNLLSRKALMTGYRPWEAEKACGR